MTAEIFCLGQMAMEVPSQTEYLRRQGKTLRKWSRTILKRTKSIGAHETNVREWLSPAEGQRLLGELREYQQELEMKNDELRSIKEELVVSREKEKGRNLDSLGTLAGGIAHDFNNLFQGLLGNLSLAKMSIPASGKAVRFLENVEQVYTQASELTKQLIAISSGDGSLPVDMHLSRHIRDAVALKLSTSPFAVAFDLAADLWPVNIDAGQFRQVLDNLVTNAIEAMPGEGRIWVTAVNEHQPGGRLPTTLPPGRYVTLSIRDQGRGIRKEDLPRIFDPYFSTKRRGAKKGMGMGLALCNSIIHKHGGAITVKTAVGQGATFHVHLPAVTMASAKTAINQEVPGHGPRILIMDDDAAVADVATKYLRMCGYRVDSAADSEAAIAAFHEARAAKAPYAAVILDLTIPGSIGGREVCAILKATDPEVKAIISSGYGDDPTMTDFLAHGFEEVLVKPYPLEKMKAVLAGLV
jgi:signal transduction histidine kinase/CheY-like chemotaxis protein